MCFLGLSLLSPPTHAGLGRPQTPPSAAASAPHPPPRAHPPHPPATRSPASASDWRRARRPRSPLDVRAAAALAIGCRRMPLVAVAAGVVVRRSGPISGSAAAAGWRHHGELRRATFPTGETGAGGGRLGWAGPVRAGLPRPGPVEGGKGLNPLGKGEP